MTYDLTPFAGLLTDGKPHEFRVHVAGVPAGQSGWFTVPNLQVWTDKVLRQTGGGLTSYAVTPVRTTEDVTGTPGEAGAVHLKASRTLDIVGYVDTSAGRIRTTVHRTLGNVSDHGWEAGESRDSLDASWRDTSITTRGGKVELTDLSYGKNGVLTFLPNATIPGGYDVVTDLKIHDTARTTAGLTTETYDGRASWIYGVPRDQRHATGTQTVRYRAIGTDGCYDHTLQTVNGVYTKDFYRC